MDILKGGGGWRDLELHGCKPATILGKCMPRDQADLDVQPRETDDIDSTSASNSGAKRVHTDDVIDLTILSLASEEIQEVIEVETFQRSSSPIEYGSRDEYEVSEEHAMITIKHLPNLHNRLISTRNSFLRRLKLSRRQRESCTTRCRIETRFG